MGDRTQGVEGKLEMSKDASSEMLAAQAAIPRARPAEVARS